MLVSLLTIGAQTAVRDQTFLTTPGAPWTIRIDDKSLVIKEVQTRPDEKSLYVLMLDEKEEMNVSLFIEPIDKCKTSDECRDFILKTGNPAWGKFQDLAKGTLGDFSYFEFFRSEAGGLPLRMFDMYAEFVREGYWVDLHLSKTSYKKEDHALFENYVKAMTFVSKTGSERNDSENVQKIASDWLALWDGAKCRESYVALTSISRDGVSEKQWMTYCDSFQKDVGRPKSRKVITTSLTKSLPSKPEYSGATLRYQSVWDRGTTIEYVSLTREKDGRWTVSNYVLQ